MNPWARSKTYSRLGNLLVPRLFRFLPVPPGFALLTTTGRKSGKARRILVRAARDDSTVYVVSLLGERGDWLHNARASAAVRLKLGSHEHEATAREVVDGREREAAGAAYAGRVRAWDYVDYASLYWGFPTRSKIERALKGWVRDGVLMAMELKG